MNLAVWFLLLLFPPEPSSTERGVVRELIDHVAKSGRVSEIGKDGENLDDPRQYLAPGAPPITAFRYFAGAERHRFSNLDLVIDDAGH